MPTRPGITVWSVRSSVRAPAGTRASRADVTAVILPFSITIVWSSRGGAPVPSTTRTWVSAIDGSETLTNAVTGSASVVKLCAPTEIGANAIATSASIPRRPRAGLKEWATVAQPFRAASVNAVLAMTFPSVLAHLRVGLDEVRLVVRRLRIGAALEIEQLDLPEVRRRSFRLDGDIARRERRAVNLDRRIHGVHGAAADLRLGVFEDRLAVDDVAHELVAVHFDFDAHPL